MELKGQTAFITGSTRGIGLAIAKAFAKQGVHIILNGRRPVSEALIAEIKALGVNCIGISGDISNSEEVKQMVKQANELWDLKEAICVLRIKKKVILMLWLLLTK